MWYVWKIMKFFAISIFYLIWWAMRDEELNDWSHFVPCFNNLGSPSYLYKSLTHKMIFATYSNYLNYSFSSVNNHLKILWWNNDQCFCFCELNVQIPRILKIRVLVRNTWKKSPSARNSIFFKIIVSFHTKFSNFQWMMIHMFRI